MSQMKRFAEEIAEELGKDTILNPEVVALGTLRLNRRSYEKEAQFWVSYDVGTNGQVNFMRNYALGHSMKCKWTAFLNDLSAHSTMGTWRVIEDTSTRKAVAYTDRYIKMTVFQLVTVNVLNDPPPAEYSESEYKSLGQCIQDGTHLTDCDDDGYCNYCGEQDGPPVEEAPPLDVRCAACGWVDVPMKDGRCYNCGASLVG